MNLILSPEITRIFSQARMLAADGRCKTFAAGADGYVRSEGCGMVLLKRLSDAVADGDRILAVIRGSAVNQDGRSNGLTAPNGPAQEAVIRAALHDAGARPEDVDYVEAHGTGTELGDPIELQALAAALRANADGSPRLQVGSVKTNIGHLEAAAGIAGLIKVVLCLGAKELPAHLHMAEPNPLIPWDQLAVDVVRSRQVWEVDGKRRLAGVSSFGFGGTNAHVIVEEAPVSARAATGPERPMHLLVVSGRDETVLEERAARLTDSVTAATGEDIADVCFTCAAGRAHFEHRVAILAENGREALAGLEAIREGAAGDRIIRGRAGRNRPQMGMLFTGQGSQYVGMGRRLFETEPTFRQAMLRCDSLCRQWQDRSLLDLTFGGQDEPSPLDRTLYAQPALFALEWSLAQLWLSWGIRPVAVMGHSLGEYVAACVAGVFSLEDGLRLVVERARLMDGAPGRGRMVAVFAAAARDCAAAGSGTSFDRGDSSGSGDRCLGSGRCDRTSDAGVGTARRDVGGAASIARIPLASDGSDPAGLCRGGGSCVVYTAEHPGGIERLG